MTTEQMAQTLYELQQQNIQTAEYISVLAAERDALRERLKRRETLLAEIRDKFILHFRLLTEVSGNKEEQEFISRWRDRIDNAGCYAASPLVEDGDKLYVGREVWTISRPEAKEGGAEPIPAMFLPEDDRPVLRVDCQRLISAGCTERDALREGVELANIALEQLGDACDELRERALAAETRNIGLIHEADEAKKGEASYRRMYEERREKHLEAVARAEKAEADNARIGNICQDLRMACSQMSRAQQQAEADCAVLREALMSANYFIDGHHDANCAVEDECDCSISPILKKVVSSLTDTQAGARMLAVVRSAEKIAALQETGEYRLGVISGVMQEVFEAAAAYRQQEGQDNGDREAV